MRWDGSQKYRLDLHNNVFINKRAPINKQQGSGSGFCTHEGDLLNMTGNDNEIPFDGMNPDELTLMRSK